jgi:adenylate cyclase
MSSPSAPKARRQLAAILSADAVGYSRRMAADEAATVAAMRSNRETLGGFVREHHGRVVNAVGDNLLAEFASAVDAAACAVAAQRELARRDADVPDDERLRFRIGVHLGDLVIEDDEIFGDGINIAARLEAIAEPGGVAASAAVVDQVRGKIEAAIEDLGERTLKNIPQPVRVYALRPLAEGETAAGGATPTVPGFGGRPAIAVMPFEHRGTDPDQAFLADGIAEDAIARLSAFRLFPVISRSSTFTYKDKRVDARQVSRELGARYVVEGSVHEVGGREREIGSRVRVAVQLIDGVQGVQVASDRWERERGDVLALQDDIVATIVSAIEPALARAERQRAQRKPVPQLDAWESFQRARWLAFGFRSADDVREAVRLYARARELDPSFATAAALEALARFTLITYLWEADADRAAAEALRIAEIGLALDEEDPTVQTALGYASGINGDHARELAAFERAIELNPSLTIAYEGLAGALCVERPDDAIRIAEKAIRLSPRDPHMYFLVHRIALGHLMAGRYEDAVARDEEALRLRRDQPQIYRVLAAAYGYLGRSADALATLEKMYRVAPQFTVEGFRRANSPALVDTCLEGWRRAGWTPPRDD